MAAINDNHVQAETFIGTVAGGLYVEPVGSQGIFSATVMLLRLLPGRAR